MLKGERVFSMKDMEKIISALLTSDTQKEASAKAGISDRTLRSYLANPLFNAEYQRRKQKVLLDATRQIQSNLKTAITALHQIITNETSSDGSKISASRVLLEYGLRFTEITDIMTRLEALEKSFTDE